MLFRSVEWLKLREAELEMHPELLFREKRQTLCPTLRETGLRTMIDIPVPHAIMGDFRDLIDEDKKLVK